MAVKLYGRIVFRKTKKKQPTKGSVIIAGYITGGKHIPKGTGVYKRGKVLPFLYQTLPGGIVTLCELGFPTWVNFEPVLNTHVVGGIVAENIAIDVNIPVLPVPSPIHP